MHSVLSVVCEELTCCCCCAPSTSTLNHEMSQHTCTVYAHVRMAEFFSFFFFRSQTQNHACSIRNIEEKKTVWPNCKCFECECFECTTNGIRGGYGPSLAVEIKHIARRPLQRHDNTYHKLTFLCIESCKYSGHEHHKKHHQQRSDDSSFLGQPDKQNPKRRKKRRWVHSQATPYKCPSIWIGFRSERCLIGNTADRLS